MSVRTYAVHLESKTGLLMHADNLEWKAKIERWQHDPKNKGKSIAGDDRSPAWLWIGCLYHDGNVIAIPQDMVMSSLMGAGAEVNEPKPSKKTFKARTQSGMVSPEQFWPLLVNGAPIPMKDVLALVGNEDFHHHLDVVQRLGFALDIRRVRVGMSKHVRVRPIFSTWAARGVMTAWDDALTTSVLEQIFEIAGDRKGIGEWRPSSRTPGPFGRFKVTLEEVAGVAV
jgi:hypothetical protein